MNPPTITVEFYGIPRARAGRKDLVVSAATAGAALLAVASECPELANALEPDGTLTPHYRLSMDGEFFVTDLAHVLHSGDRLLLLSADAGG